MLCEDAFAIAFLFKRMRGTGFVLKPVGFENGDILISNYFWLGLRMHHLPSDIV
jgi:hypothetical protein